jgi:D-lactate dehydrogenase
VMTFFDVADGDQEKIKRFFEKTGEAVKLIHEGLDSKTVNEARDSEVVSLFVSSKLTKELMDNLPKLKLIACRSTGFDNVDLGEAKRRGIVVSNVPSYGENTVAEYTIMLMLALTRKLVPSTDQVKDGEIDRTKLTGVDVCDKTLGVIGTGRIGQNVIRIARALDMKVIAYDLYPNQKVAAELNFTYASFDEVLKRADVVTLHAPATKENYHLIDKEELAMMKPGAMIVNTARGELINAEALAESVSHGHIGGAGLDVIEGENLMEVRDEVELLTMDGKNSQLAASIDVLEKLPNVILTPHNAFNSEEATGRILLTSLENIRSFLDGKVVNQVG